jgi:serine/threonine-protein phosphatase 2A regulatory subunit A
MDTMDDDDEVLLGLAMSLGRMIPHLPNDLLELIQPLETLLTVEDSAVRQAATESTQQLADKLTSTQLAQEYAAMVQRLAQQEWFTARLSAVSLLAYSHQRWPAEIQKQHLDLYTKLAKDDTPMVRRIAAKYLGDMVEQAVAASGRPCLQPGGYVPALLLPIYEHFASTDQPDSVRLQTTANCVALGRALSQVTQNDKEALSKVELDLLHRVLPLIVATIDDRSWRVRWMAANEFATVIAAYDPLPSAMDSLIPAFEKLLQDPEAEVRTAATLNLAQVATSQARVPLPSSHRAHEGDTPLAMSNIPRVSVAERLVQKITSLTEDDSEHVRSALARVATALAPILGRDATIAHLVPPVLLLLRDAASEVRLHLISSLAALNEVIGVDLLSQSLLPAILDLAQDGKWRIRLAIIQTIPLLAQQLGKEFFTEKLASICIGWLGDDIASIRRAAAANLEDITRLFGKDWAQEFLLPPLKEFQQHPSYLRRLTALQAFAHIARAMDSDVARLIVLPLILEMANDIVPNIRFNVAKELQTVTPVCGMSTYETQVLPILSMLLQDEDRDVRFYAEKTASGLEEHFASAAP